MAYNKARLDQSIDGDFNLLVQELLEAVEDELGGEMPSKVYMDRMGAAIAVATRNIKEMV